MSEVNSVSNNVFSDFSIRKQQQDEAKDNELGQKAFLELMITQLKNQSPLSPQDNSEFVAQLAQFSSVESLDKLNTNFDSFTNSFVANQALQASTLVGRSVTVPADTTMLEPGGLVSASVDVPASTGDVTISIFAQNGALVEKISVGPQPAGEMVMRWDGKNIEINGELLDWQSDAEEGRPAGIYRFDIAASVDGIETALDTALSANVNSVTIGQNGSLVLNLAGVGAVSLADVRQFNE